MRCGVGGIRRGNRSARLRRRGFVVGVVGRFLVGDGAVGRDWGHPGKFGGIGGEGGEVFGVQVFEEGGVGGVEFGGSG